MWLAVIELNKYKSKIRRIPMIKNKGYVDQVIGLIIYSVGPRASIGELCYINNGKEQIPSEVVGFRDDKILLMPLGVFTGIRPGTEVIATGSTLNVKVSEKLRGRVLDALGNPMDGLESVEGKPCSLTNTPPHPLQRKRIDEVLQVGVKVLDGMLTCGIGQRLGIFAGSGVGKSTLLGMISRNSKADINVIALIGERGREVKEFLEKDLGPEGLEKSIVVVASSDQPALYRIKGAYTATAIAEYFRDKGYNVMLMMDSVTRFAMAQRELGLAIGEPPATKGYPPSVFAELPKLLERAGASDKGTITGLYTVLVDGDDMNEPIADAVRGILDGHVVLSRKIASQNHYPSVDILNSVSRVMKDIVTNEHYNLSQSLKELTAVYNEAKDLIDVGAYVKGSNPKIDRAMQKIDAINTFLKQDVYENYSLEDTVSIMKKIINDGKS
ncbi:MAG: flagellar protein export ATPase FliI [Clostridia bacterium]|nr:flagellar protein export ATPase FliI [Clostridia bacterium]